MKREHFFESIDRYGFDFFYCTASKNFAQIDTSQDAWYYGQWCNPFDLQVVSYMEGDIYIDHAENVDEFKTELNNIKAWTIENGFEFRGIDPGFNKKLKQRLIEIELESLLH